jgi:hypothetical protein
VPVPVPVPSGIIMPERDLVGISEVLFPTLGAP